MSATRYEVWIGNISMRIIPTANIRSIRAKCEAGTFPSISMESSIRKRPSRTFTNKLWLGRGRSFEIAANCHNIRRRCSCTYVCAQSKEQPSSPRPRFNQWFQLLNITSGKCYGAFECGPRGRIWAQYPIELPVFFLLHKKCFLNCVIDIFVDTNIDVMQKSSFLVDV